MAANDITSFNELVEKVFSDKSGILYHHTSYESLVMILKGRSFRLSRYDLMNDIAEKELSRCQDGDSRYIVSFTGAKAESVAMWALYGKKSSLKLRLSFPRDTLIKSVRNNFYFDPQLTNRIPIWDTNTINRDASKKGFSLSDVVYFDRDKKQFRLSGKPITSFETSEQMIADLAGTIKYDAWEYEREARLSVVLHQEPSSLSEITHIYAGLTDDLIQKMTVTYSPWISETLFQVLSENIDALAGCKLTHKKSTLHGEITEL